MKAEIVRIGNSKGVRIPRSVIEQCGFADRVEMQVEGDRLIISPVRRVRVGWDTAFAVMAEAGDDAALLPDDLERDADQTEWEW